MSVSPLPLGSECCGEASAKANGKTASVVGCDIFWAVALSACHQPSSAQS